MVYDIVLTILSDLMNLLTWVCLKIGKTPKPNGFHDHYPVFKNGYFLGNINPTFSDKPT